MSITPKLAPATEVFVLSTLSAVFSCVTLVIGLAFGSTPNLVFSGGLFAVFLVSIPFVIRMANANKNMTAEASQKIVADLEREYGIKILPSEKLFVYNDKIELTDRDVLATDAYGKSVLVTLRADSSNDKVVPFVTRTAVQVA